MEITLKQRLKILDVVLRVQFQEYLLDIKNMAMKTKDLS
jgi:hypothetical protein